MPESEDNTRFLFNDRSTGRCRKLPLLTIVRVSNYMQTHVGELFHIQKNILGGALAKYSYLTNPKEQTTDYLDRICKWKVAAD